MRWADLDKRAIPGVAAWVGMTVYICSVDGALFATKNKTMSEVFEDSLSHPVKRWPVIVAWGIVTAHLFTHGDMKYKRVDPIHHVGKVLELVTAKR